MIDLNNDNELDLVVNGYNTDLDAVAQVYLNVNQTLELQYELPPVSDGKMAFADFNGDGFQDFVLSGQDENYDPYLAVYTNNGQGNFTEKIIEGEGLTGASIQTGDVNNDGFFDFILLGDDADYNGHTNFFIYNPSLQNFEKLTDNNLLQLGSGGNVALFDYNNDGNLDILANGFDWNDANLLPYTKLYRNTTTNTNEKPNAPTILTTSIDEEKVNFSWSGATDDKTLEPALQYELTVGSQSGTSEIAQYTVTTKSWYLKKENLPSHFYWSVKSIDAAKKYSEASQPKEVLLGVSDVNKTLVKFYPNPVKDMLHIKTSQKISSFSIYNVAGQKTITGKVTDQGIEFSRLPKGTYLVEVTLENAHKITHKMIKN